MWLLCASDDSYARPLAVTLHSALRNASLPRINVTVVSDGISAENKARISRVVELTCSGTSLTWVDASSLDATGLTGARHVSASTYLRLFVGDLLPNHADRAIYLDADVLVRHDLADLYETDLQGKALGAVRDMVIADLRHPYSRVVDLGVSSLPSDAPYFNEGVLVVDFHRWRSTNSGEALLAYAKARPGHGNLDQDALNGVMVNEWLEVDMSWNVQGSLLRLQEHPRHQWVAEMRRRREALLENPRIVHFSGSIKPWHASSTHPYAKEWRRALATSGWYSTQEKARWMVQSVAKRAAVRALVCAGRRPRRETARP